ncbi:MAG: transposase [Chitinophagales bacterium]
MSRRYKFTDNEELYFISFAVVNWIDLFIRDEYKEVLMKSIQYCQHNKDLDVYAYCIMTSHVHLIIGSRGNPMSNIMRDLKRHTSEELRKAIQRHPKKSRKEWMIQMMEEAGRQNSNNRGFQLWQQDNHPIALSTEKIMHQKLDYLHDNPVEAGFVEEAEDWLYSSAKQYYTGQKGRIDIIQIEPRLNTV